MTDGKSFEVDFYLRRDHRGWRIVDVIAEGISYLRTYRSDFGAEVRSEGLEALILRLEGAVE
jgi:ABC-type transporter MlaC component